MIKQRILESDIISKKICRKCYKNTQKIYEIRQAALKQTQNLKDKCHQQLGDKGIRLPNTCVSIKKVIRPCQPVQQATVPIEEPSLQLEDNKSGLSLKPFVSNTGPEINGLHSSVIDIYKKYPNFKIPKKCLARHLSPIVSFTMGEVESYFKKFKLEMHKYIYRPNSSAVPSKLLNGVAKKKTSAPFKTVSPLTNQKSNIQIQDKTVPFKEKIIVHNSFTIVNSSSSDEHGASLQNNSKQQNNVNERTDYPKDKVKNKGRFQPNENNCKATIPRVVHIEFNTSNAETELAQNITEGKQMSNTEDHGTVIIPSDEVAERPLTKAIPVKRKIPLLEDLSLSPKLRKTTDQLKKIESNSVSITSKTDEALTQVAGISELSITNKKQTPEPSTSKPEFIESLGLTPAVEHVPSILLCKICNSLHQNVASLKKHNSRHRICPYCKLKCKSVDRKQKHIDLDCEVKKIMDSPGLYVSLQKVEGYSEVRKQYKDVFSAFGLIGELEKELLLNDDCSQISSNVIVLSDGDESRATVTEDVQTTDAEVSINLVEDEDPDSIPIVSIHNNDILEKVRNNLSDRIVIKQLAALLNKSKSVTKTEEVQTMKPRIQDLSINKNDACRLTNFRTNLLSYLIPVELKNGSFSVSFVPTPEPKSKSTLSKWSELTLIDKRSTNSSQEVPLMNATYPLAFVTSQVQSSQVSLSSIQVMTTTPTMSIILPNTSAFLPNPGLSIQAGNTVTQTQTINNTFFTPITTTSIQTTPLVQNYTLSMGPLPIINNQVPIQTNTTVTTNNDLNQSESTASSSTNVMTQSGSGRKTHKSLSKSKKSSIRSRKSLLKGKGRGKRKIIKVNIGKLASKSTKVRVKNIWELK